MSVSASPRPAIEKEALAAVALAIELMTTAQLFYFFCDTVSDFKGTLVVADPIRSILTRLEQQLRELDDKLNDSKLAVAISNIYLPGVLTYNDRPYYCYADVAFREATRIHQRIQWVTLEHNGRVPLSVVTEGSPDVDVNVALYRWSEIKLAFSERRPDAEAIQIYLEREQMELQKLQLSPPEPPRVFATEFHRLESGIDRMNGLVVWRGLSIPCPHNYLLILAGLCRMRLAGKLRCTMRTLVNDNGDLAGVKFYDAALPVSDSRLLDLVDRPPKQYTKRGYALNLPSEILVPIT